MTRAVEQATVTFLSNDWDDVPGTQQHMMTLLAQRRPLLLVETIGLSQRRPVASDVGRLWRRLRRWLRGPRPIGPQAWVLSPAALPYLRGSAVQRFNGRWLRWQVLRAVRRLGFEHPLCWVYLPSRAILELLPALQPSCVFYECLDDYTQFQGAPPETARVQRELAQRSHLVVTVSERLRERLAPLNPQTYLVPNACDVDHFAIRPDAVPSTPRDMTRIPRPRLGYIGSFDYWVDLELLGYLARARPHWSVVLIGPITVLGLDALRRLPNVWHLGRKPYAVLPQYLQAIDVVVLPYRATEYTEAIDPLKMYEALAAGRPVVSTDYPAARRFHDALRITRSPQEFLHAVERALQEQSPQEVERRRQTVRHLTWRHRLETIEQLLRERGPARRPKVLQVITRLVAGGAADNVIATATELRRLGWDATIAAAPYARNVAMAEARGVPMIPMAAFCRSLRPWRDLRALVSLARLMRRERYVLVHSHTSKAGVLAPLAARLAGVPCVVHSPRGSIYHELFVPRWLHGFFAAIERGAALTIDRLTVLCDAERQDYLRRRIAPADKYRLIRSGMDVEPFLHPPAVDVAEMRRDLGLRPQGPVIGHVARLVPEKGHRDALAAFARVAVACPTAQLLMVGEGPLESCLRHEVARHHLTEQVVFAGFRADVPAVLQGLDVFIQPSLWDALPRAVVEAMLVGKPIVATTVGGIPEVVKHEETGLLVPPHDPPALAEAIVRLLEDPGLAQRLAVAGRSSVARDFDIVHTTQQLAALYEELLTGRPA